MNAFFYPSNRGINFAKIRGFKVTDYTVSLSASPSGSGTVTGGGQYDSGSSVNIKATPASGYHFVKWSDGSTDANRTLNVLNSDITLQAIFAADAPQGGGDEGGGSGSGGGSEEENDPYNYG